MKRVIILAILLLLVACTSETNNNNETSSTDETSNAEGPTPEVLSTKGDLIPKIYTDTSYADLNEELEITLAVQNLGVQRIDNEEFDYKVVLSRDGMVLSEKEGTFKDLFLPTEEKVLYKFTHKFDVYGEYEVTLSLDVENSVSELKENNNNKTITIYVKEKTTSSNNDGEEDTTSAKTGLQDDDARDEVAKSGCYDSDGGQDFETEGTCYDDSSFISGRDDFCATDEKLAELFCEAKRCNIVMKECGGICSNGKCI